MTPMDLLSEKSHDQENGVARHSTTQMSAGILQTEKSLWYWNLGCGILHLVQAIIVLAIGLSDNSSAGKFRLPLTTLFLQFNENYFTQDLVQQGLIRFTAVTSGFAWMSAAAHFIVLLCYETYKNDLRRGINKFRWIEYAFSSSLMIGLIAMLFGVYDILSLVLIMSVNACMNFFGLLMEILNQDKSKDIIWSPFIFGCFAGVVPWAVIFAYLGGSSNASQVPGFVWGILIAYLVMFNTFPVNMVLQYCKVSYWSDKYWGYEGGGYYYGEKVYQILSLVAKTLLLWLVVGGTNQPNNYSN